MSVPFQEKHKLGGPTTHPLLVFHAALVKYGQEPAFSTVRTQIDISNSQLLQVIRDTSVITPTEMKEILNQIQAIDNIPLKPNPVEVKQEKDKKAIEGFLKVFNE